MPITHLAATENIDKIMDGCLYGRQNLNDLHIKFRKAALGDADIKQGDGNVICFGPDLIDPICIKERTIGIELDLDKVLDNTNFNRNPCMFFKQKDLLYTPRILREINLKNETIFFEILHKLDGSTQWSKCSNSEQLYPSVQSKEILSPLLISYNLEEMQKIWVLNSFRFIDDLWIDELNVRLYNHISQLSDIELVDFLTDFGKKMSCSSEFNFYGAYKIDLNAIRKFHFYAPLRSRNTSRMESQDTTIEMKQLTNELNSGNFASLNKIKQLAPELLKSKRFVDFLLSTITDCKISEQITSC